MLMLAAPWTSKNTAWWLDRCIRKRQHHLLTLGQIQEDTRRTGHREDNVNTVIFSFYLNFGKILPINLLASAAAS